MIQVSNLTKHYGQRTAINDLNFEINAGEIVGFLGPNGAGKSTTMKILTGFMPASLGSAKIAGYDVFTHPIEVKANVGYLPETPPVYLEMTVGDYIEYAAKLHQVPKAQFKSAVDTAIQKTSLGDVRKRVIGNLSKGYRQRVGLAQAIVHSPKVLILDEPTVGLDPKQIIEIRDLIKGLAGNHTVILSSHILHEVTATCQRIIVINKGRIVAEDSIDALTHRMKQGASFGLTVKRPDSAFVNELKALKGIAGVSLEGSRYAIQMDSGSDDARDEVVAAAVRKGLGVLEFSPDKVSLEEVFIELTNQQEERA